MKPIRTLLATAAMTAAITAVMPAHALDLLQAWQGAERHAPDAAAASAAREAGAARAEQAQALWRPAVIAEGGLGYAAGQSTVRGAQFAAPGFGQSTGVAFDTSVNGGLATRYAVALKQPLYSRERSAQGRALQVAAEAAGFEWAAARQALMLRTTEAYFAAALAAEKLRLVMQQQQAVDRAATEAQDRFRIGDRPVTDVHEATARAATLKAERLAAETQLQLARTALADLTGVPSDDQPLPMPATRATDSTDDLGSLPDWLARADRANPHLRLAQAQVRGVEAQASASAAAFSPTVDAVGRIARDRLAGHGDFGRASSSQSSSAIGVQVAVPLYTGGMRSAQHSESTALLRKAQAELDAARQQVAQQTRAAWLDVAVGASRIGALTAAVDASRARLDATRTGLAAGDRTTLDLLNAQNDAAGAELALAEARTRLVTNRLRLAALAGELDDAVLQQANARLTPP